ncbi:MAG: HNH endonuclease, partial [bacterium]
MIDPIRQCLRQPIPQIFEAATLLKAAVDAHLAADYTTAAACFRAANLPSVRDWTESIWGKHSPEILCVRAVPGAPPILPKESRIKVRMPTTEEQNRLIKHFGYRCAFCGIPLI